MSTLSVDQLQLAPLGAGDLIDRTVRLYRRHFMPLIRASAPPIIIQTVGVVVWTVAIQAAASTEAEGRLVVYFLLSVFALVLRFIGFMLQLIVLGGATRNFVMHLLKSEPVSARTIYRNVRSRFWGLLGATLAMMMCAVISAGVALIAVFLVQMILFITMAIIASVVAAWLIAAISIVFTIGIAFGGLYLFFLLAGRVAYVPQVMMVEAKGVFAAIGRSVDLAKGNVRRLMAMFLFTTFATLSVQMLLVIPFGALAYVYGVNLLEFDSDRTPAWYSIGSQVAFQLGAILMAPIWTLGLSLLYVDERVRHEAYDVELLAAQHLGDMPEVPLGILAPLTPAIVNTETERDKVEEDSTWNRGISILPK